MATKKIEPTYQFDGGMILPTGAGSGKVLQSDSSGNASWIIGAGGSQWFTYVGTGTPSPGTFTGEKDIDFCVRSSDGEVFKRVSGAWVDQGYALGYAMQTAARAYRTASLAISNGSVGTVALDSFGAGSYDPGGNLDHVAGTYVCPVTGYYQVNGEVYGNAPSSATIMYAMVYKGSSEISRGTAVVAASTGQYIAVTVSDIIQCAAGDVLSLRIYNMSAVGAINVASSIGSQSNYFSVVKVDTGGRPGNGWRVYNGAGTPTVAGNDGDWCIRQADGEVFQLVTGVWTDQGWSLAGANLNATVAARATRAASGVSLAAGAWTKIPMDTITFDPGNHMDAVNHRYNCPVAGYYLVSGQVDIGVATPIEAAIYKNGVVASAGTYTPTGYGVTITDIVQCNAGDYLELWCSNNSGGGQALALQVGVVNWLSVSLVAATAVPQQPLQAATQARAYRNAAFTMDIAAWKKIPVDTLSFDASGGAMDVTTNHRYNCPTGGYYAVSAEVGFTEAANANSNCGIAIYKNGALACAGSRGNGSDTGFVEMVVTDVIQCNAGDYLELWAYASVAAPLSVAATQNYLSVSQVGTNPVAAPSYAARAHRINALGAYVAGAWTRIPLDTVDTDPSGCIRLSDGKYVCPIAGTYDVDASVMFNASGSGTYTAVAVAIAKNGTLVSYTETIPAIQSYGAGSVSDKVACNAGDTLELWFANGQGTTLTLGTQTNFLAVSLVTQAPTPLPVTTPQVITTGGLPSSPVDGQEVYFVADATNGVVWHLKYRAGSASAYKWEFVGGSVLTANNTGNVAVAISTTTLDSLSITLPLGGDYEFEFGARMYLNSAAAGEVSMQIDWITGATVHGQPGVIDTWLNAQTGQPFSNVVSEASWSKQAGVAAGDKFRTRLVAGGTAANFEKTYIRTKPIRVG